MDTSRKNISLIHFVLLISFIVLFVSSVFLQLNANKRKAETACNIILEQLDDVIAENEKNVNTLMETLKDEYTVRAAVIADIVDNSSFEFTAEKYKLLAAKCNVDEIHIFDESGTIISGSNPEYYGYSLDSGQQISFFKPMLDDKSLRMCQDAVPNTAAGKTMMYAIVWNDAGTQMVQVGVTPERLLKIMQDSDMTNLIKRMPVTEGMSIFVVDDESGTVVGSTKQEMLDYKLADSDRLVQELEENRIYNMTAKIQGERQYIAFKSAGENDIVVSYSVKASNKNIVYTMLPVFLCLIISFFVICFVTGHSIYKMNKKEEELVKAKEASEQASAAKQVFLSRMSHDIRTPLNGIIGLIDINEKHADDRALVDSNRKKERVAAEHLLELINDVLEFNKIDSPNVRLSYEPFNVIELCDDVLTITATRAAENGIAFIHGDCTPEIKYPYVYGSPLHVRQIFINIIGNAIKYNRPGGSVTCSTSSELLSSGKVLYTAVVSDTGIGMSEEFIKHLYEPFTQENSDVKSVYDGTGLGMSIVKQLVDKMSGSIDVVSKKGEGTTFTVKIPFDIAKESDIPKRETGSDNADITGVRILLAEDNELNLEIANTLLSDAGAVVTSAVNGAEAVRIFEEMPENSFDIILMDIMMPIMDGYEATKKIRSSGKSDAKSICIIAMTANAFAEDAERAINAGMNAHMSKPLNIKKVIATISEYASQTK